jgi:hypothetical protein
MPITSLLGKVNGMGEETIDRRFTAGETLKNGDFVYIDDTGLARKGTGSVISSSYVADLAVGSGFQIMNAFFITQTKIIVFLWNHAGTWKRVWYAVYEVDENGIVGVLVNPKIVFTTEASYMPTVFQPDGEGSTKFFLNMPSSNLAYLYKIEYNISTDAWTTTSCGNLPFDGSGGYSQTMLMMRKHPDGTPDKYICYHHRATNWDGIVFMVNPNNTLTLVKRTAFSNEGAGDQGCAEPITDDMHLIIYYDTVSSNLHAYLGLVKLMGDNFVRLDFEDISSLGASSAPWLRVMPLTSTKALVYFSVSTSSNSRKVRLRLYDFSKGRLNMLDEVVVDSEAVVQHLFADFYRLSDNKILMALQGASTSESRLQIVEIVNNRIEISASLSIPYANSNALKIGKIMPTGNENVFAFIHFYPTTSALRIEQYNVSDLFPEISRTEYFKNRIWGMALNDAFAGGLVTVRLKGQLPKPDILIPYLPQYMQRSDGAITSEPTGKSVEVGYTTDTKLIMDVNVMRRR